MQGKTSLPIRELDFKVTAEQESVLVTTYMPEAEFNVTYYKSVPLIQGASIQEAFQRVSSFRFSLIVNDELSDNEEGVDLSAEDFVDNLAALDHPAADHGLRRTVGRARASREAAEAQVRGWQADGVLVAEFPGPALSISKLRTTTKIGPG